VKMARKTGTAPSLLESAVGKERVSIDWDAPSFDDTVFLNPFDCDACSVKSDLCPLHAKIQKLKKDSKNLYGPCRMKMMCDCGLCAFIKQDPDQPHYKASNQVVRYRRNNVLPPDTGSTFLLGYKEPLTTVEDGFGFFGTLRINKQGTHVQCHECGFFFEELGMHTKEHGYPAKEYKRKFGLHLSKPLLTEKGQGHWKGEHSHNYTEEHRTQASQAIKQATIAQRTSESIGKDGWPLARYNQLGICPVQLLDNIVNLANELDRSPSVNDYRDAFGRGKANIVYKTFGSWNEALKSVGLKPLPAGWNRTKG
jgi:hypothetical protein